MAEPGVKIRKVMVDLPGEDTGKGEFVLLHNNGPDDVSMSDWRLGDTNDHPLLPYVYTFPQNFVLPAGTGVRVRTEKGTDGGGNLFWGVDNAVWTNEVDRVVLVDKAEQLVDSVAWDTRPQHGRVIRTDEVAEEIAAHASTVGFADPVGPVQWAVRENDTEFFWQEFSGGGAIFHSGFLSEANPNKQMVDVRSEIFTKYQSLAGSTAAAVKKFGMPLTRTQKAAGPNPQAFLNEFNGFSIYWSQETNAHVVGGAIRDKWLSAEVGGSAGSFGLPIEDEREDRAGGTDLRFSEFEHGSIWWTPAAGARAFSEIRVEFVGFHCFGESAFDGFSGSDELYFSIDVEPLDRPRNRPQQVDDSVWVTTLPPKGPVYEGVDTGHTKLDRVVVFQGRPAPLRIKALAFEQDHSDANALRGEIKAAVAAVGAVGSALVPAASAVLLNPEVQAAVTNLINRIADTSDDFLGRGLWQVGTRQDLLRVLDAGLQPEPNTELQFHGAFFLTDGDASHKVYFEIIPVLR